MLEFMSVNQMYIVLGIVMLVWFGIIFYLVRLDLTQSLIPTILYLPERLTHIGYRQQTT